MANILASPIQRKPHLSIFDEIDEARFAALDISQTIVLLIDNVDSSALFSLFKQFDLLGFYGWAAVETDAAQRSVLKKAIELKRYAGTPYGLKEALRVIGFPNTEIFEGIGDYFYDGTINYDGTGTYSKASWASFILVLDIGNDFGINADLIAKITGVVNQYKRAVTELDSYRWKAGMSDQLIVGDDELEIQLIFEDINEELQPGAFARYGGKYKYNGAITYGEQNADSGLAVNTF